MSKIKRTVYPPGTMIIATSTSINEKKKHFIALEWIVTESKGGRYIGALPVKVLSVENQTTFVHKLKPIDDWYGYSYAFQRPGENG